MYQQLEQQFEETAAREELEAHKQRLQALRDIHKPLSHKDLLRHQRRTDARLRAAEDEIERKRAQERAQFKEASAELGRLKSRVLEQVVQKDLLLKSLQHEKLREIQDARRKVISYAKYVKEMHQPHVRNSVEIRTSARISTRAAPISNAYRSEAQPERLLPTEETTIQEASSRQ